MPEKPVRDHGRLPVDECVRGLMLGEPPADVIYRVRHSLRNALSSEGDGGLLTLQDVQRILRLTDDEMDSIVDDLPALEVAGQIRIRRSAFEEWLGNRERLFRREHLVRGVIHYASAG